jgi:hypothetical protein
MLRKALEGIDVLLIVNADPPTGHDPCRVAVKPQVGVLHFFLEDVIREDKLTNDKDDVQYNQVQDRKTDPE